MSELNLNQRQYLEFEKLALNAFAPLTAFMRRDEMRSVVETMRLPGGEVFPLPVVLDITHKQADQIRHSAKVALVFAGKEVGSLEPDDFFSFDMLEASRNVFGTDDIAHPGVELFTQKMGRVLVGGSVQLKERVPLDIAVQELTPEETKEAFRRAGWRTVVGFQTRNVPHRAHEYLQRVALEQVDGLFIQPLVGRKRAGDYQPAAILAGYKALIENYYPVDRVLLGVLTTYMRYAGPREAVFHAIVRRNYGCTHFIVGRDHAGVGSYYGKYAGHELVKSFGTELGITVMCLHGPYYCARCDGIVTEHTCPHADAEPSQVVEISGTWMREILGDGRKPDLHLMRAEVVDSLRGVDLFIAESKA